MPPIHQLTDNINNTMTEKVITALPRREVGGSFLGVGFRAQAHRAEDKAVAKGASSTSVSVTVLQGSHPRGAASRPKEK
jgi:hypothetical protein